MNKRILYLSYDGMTDPLGQSQVLPYLRRLSTMGYSFTLVSFEKKERFELGRRQIQDLCEEGRIRWYPLLYTKNPPVLSTWRDVRVLKNTIDKLHRREPFSLVHCRSYITALAGLWMKRRYGVKFVFDMRGFWADERVEGGLWNLNNPVFRAIYRYFKAREKAFLTAADYTIVLTEAARTEMSRWPNAETFAPVDVIPCCVDMDLFNSSLIQASQISCLKHQLALTPDQTVVSYIGSLGTWYMAGEMLEFFRAYLKIKPTAVFLIVTKDDKAAIEHLASEKGVPLSSVRIAAAQRNEMPLFIAISDFSIFFIKPVFSKKASSPTKQGEIMAMGVPLVCNENIGDTSEIIRRYSAGVVIDEFEEDCYKRLADELSRKVFDSERIRQGAAECYSLRGGVEKYAAVYAKVLK